MMFYLSLLYFLHVCEVSFVLVCFFLRLVSQCVMMQVYVFEGTPALDCFGLCLTVYLIASSAKAAPLATAKLAEGCVCGFLLF